MKSISNKCFIIGGGPSIADTDLSLIKNEFCIAINEAYRLGTFSDIWFFADSDIYKNNRKAVETWPNRIVSCAGNTKNVKKIEFYNRCRQHSICYEPGNLSFPSKGANSGATAINLAIREGFKEIILLGYDMKQVNGKNNYHTYYRKQPAPSIYEKFMLPFEAINRDKKDVVILNATIDSNLNVFPKINLIDAL